MDIALGYSQITFTSNNLEAERYLIIIELYSLEYKIENSVDL